MIVSEEVCILPLLRDTPGADMCHRSRLAGASWDDTW